MIQSGTVRRMVSWAGALALTLGVAAAGTAHAQEGPLFTHYAAFGDSFVSGVGTTGVVVDAKNPCGTGPLAWPYGVREYLGIQSMTFAACSGATTRHVVGAGGQMSKLPPADQLNNALITMMVGGNDIRLDERLQKCFQGSTKSAPDPSACGDLDQLLNNIGAVIQDSLGRTLEETYRTVRAAAPNAAIVAVGYPHLVDATNDTCDQTWTGYVLDRARRQKLNDLADALNGQIARAASNAGIYWITDEIVEKFRGHEACSGADEWIVSPDEVLRTRNLVSLSHPNDRGYPAIAEVVASAFSSF